MEDHSHQCFLSCYDSQAQEGEAEGLGAGRVIQVANGGMKCSVEVLYVRLDARDMLLMLLNTSVDDGGGGSRDSAAVLVDVVA